MVRNTSCFATGLHYIEGIEVIDEMDAGANSEGHTVDSRAQSLSLDGLARK
jgi:hypothetical protein